MKIKELNLKEYVLKTLNETKRYETYSPIQEKTIPSLIKKKNIIAISPTGSGKSDAFLASVFNNINEENDELQALILAPTRELAMQLYQKAIDYCKNNEKIVLKKILSGSTNEISGKVPHILISTPRKAYEILNNHSSFTYKKLRMIVLDEIDMLLEEEFLKYIDFFMKNLDSKIQKIGFGATLNRHVRSFAKQKFSADNVINLSSGEIKTSPGVSHYALLSRRGKKNTLFELSKVINPFICFIFLSKKEDVKEIFDFLVSKNYNVGFLHGDLKSSERKNVLNNIEDLKYQYVVTSDLMARGIDFNNITHVVSLDFPQDLNFYFHRAGRAGRMNNKGDSFVIFDDEEASKIKLLEKKGIDFNLVKIDGDKLIEKRKMDFKDNRKQDEDLIKQIAKKVPKSKKVKVKPNYKKKRKKKIEKIAKKYNYKKRKKQRRNKNG